MAQTRRFLFRVLAVSLSLVSLARWFVIYSSLKKSGTINVVSRRSGVKLLSFCHVGCFIYNYVDVLSMKSK